MSTISFDPQTLLDARKEYRSLMAIFANLYDIASSGDLSPGQLLKFFGELKKAEGNAKAVNMFDNMPQLDGFARSPPTDGSAEAAKKVFAIPELCEHILLHLDAADLRRAQQAARVFANTIKLSKKLKEVLCLLPSSKLGFCTPFGKGRFPYLTVEGSNRRKRGPTTSVQLTAKFDVNKSTGRSTLPRLGSASSNMLICQPPIHLVEARLSCCDDEEVGGSFKVFSDTGITVDDLCAASKRFMAAHRMCPHAAPSQYDSNELVKVKVHFTGDVRIGRKDVMAKEERARRRALDAKKRAAWS